MNNIAYAFIAVMVIAIAVVNFSGPSTLERIQMGELQVECDLRSGTKIIDPEMIVSFDADNSYFRFTNGGAKSCRVMAVK